MKLIRNRVSFFLLMLGYGFSLQAGTIKAPRDVPVFDPQNPDSPGGIFLQGSVLEIKGTPTAGGLVLVIYHPPEGAPLSGYCRVTDLNLSEADFPVAGKKYPLGSTPKPAATFKTRTESLEEGLALAARSHKLLFVKFGRSSCGHCMALEELMKKGEVRPDPSNFIIADIDCDDPIESRLFSQKFKVQGRTLPFVVIADSKGKQLVARSGGGRAKDFNEMMEAAKTAVQN